MQVSQKLNGAFSRNARHGRDRRMDRTEFIGPLSALPGVQKSHWRNTTNNVVGLIRKDVSALEEVNFDDQVVTSNYYHNFQLGHFNFRHS